MWPSVWTLPVQPARPAQLSAEGSTNFVHPHWAGFDIRENLAKRLGKPVTYLNDGNAGALWGHFTIFGANSRETSISVVIGTGLGGGIIIDGNVVKGKMGFGGELGHVLIPYQSIAGIAGMNPQCNCGRTGDLESLCSLTAIEKSLLPFFLPRYPGHQLASVGTCTRRRSWCEAWQKKAILCARKSSASRPMRWDSSSTRW